MTDLTIGGETFNVLIEGHETLPVLMLSNSLGTDLHLWDGQMPDLLKHFRVVRYDSRGHGGSVADDGPYSIDRLGLDALAILDALGIDKVFWMGISKGGAVGQWLMIHAPERIERAVLANTAARFGSPEGWNQRIALVRCEGMAALVDTIMQRWFSDSFVGSDAALSVKEALLDTPAVGYAACCAALRDLDLREGLYKIAHPVLVIAGDDDLSVSKAQTDLLARTIPEAALVTLRARHISNVEDRAGFTKAVIDFLTAKSPVRRSPARKTSMALPSARRPAGRRLTPSRGAVVEPHGRRATVQAMATPARTVKPERIVAKTTKETVAAKPAPKLKVAVKKAAPVAGKLGKPKAKALPPKKAGKVAAAPVVAKAKVTGKTKIVKAKAPATKISALKVAAPKTSKAVVRKPAARAAAAKAPISKTKKTSLPKTKTAAPKTKTAPLKSKAKISKSRKT